MHSFNAPLEIAEMFTKFDLTFSIGCRFPRDDTLKFIMKYGNYCFETDAPYQKPFDSDERINHINNLLVPVNYITKNLDIKKEKLLDNQFQIIANLFPQLYKRIN